MSKMGAGIQAGKSGFNPPGGMHCTSCAIQVWGEAGCDCGKIVAEGKLGSLCPECESGFEKQKRFSKSGFGCETGFQEMAGLEGKS